MDKKGIIVYHSKTGFTKRYARWLSEEMGWPSVSIKEMAGTSFPSVDVMVFGGGLHAGVLEGLAKARKIFEKSDAGRLVVFATGATPGTETEIIEEMWQRNLTEEELKQRSHFYLPGGLNYEQMAVGDRMMMWGLRFFLNHKKKQTPGEREFAKAIAHSYDISSKEYLESFILSLRLPFPPQEVGVQLQSEDPGKNDT